MQNLVFVHNAALPDATTAIDLSLVAAAGNAYIIKEDNSTVAISEAAITGTLNPESKVAFVQKPLVAGESPRRSSYFKVKDIVGVKVTVYSAGVKQKTVIEGANLPITGKYTIKIVRIDQGYEKFPTQSYEITAGGTPAANVTAIIAAVAANPSSIVTVTNVADDAVLEAKELNYSFRTMVYSGATAIASAFVTGSAVQPTPAVGTPAHILALEESASGLFGGIYQTGIVKKPTVAAVGSQTFDLVQFTIKHENVSENMLKPLQHSVITLALQAGLLDTATVTETELRTYFGV
jgi:hypothetical protein